MDKQAFYDMGLNSRETDVYISLLKKKLSNALEISKDTKINRTTVYFELENLIRKGLASYIIKDSKKYFMPAEPEKILDILDEKRNNIKKIIPELKELHDLIKKPVIEVYEGREGIKSFYLSILKEKCDVLAFGVTGYAFETLKYYFPQFMKKVIDTNINIKYIANPDSKKYFLNIDYKKFKIKYTNQKTKSKVTTIIYSNKIAIQSLIDDKFYVTIIEDENLHETYKNYFNMFWELL
jgi:sugar-specific transcriptional regulator TrmB